MKNIFTLFAFAVCSLCQTSQVQAQAQPACGTIPYSIQYKAMHGQLGLVVPDAIKARLGQLSAGTGASFVRSGFAAVSQIAFGEVLDYYVCETNRSIGLNTALSAEQRKKIATDLIKAQVALNIRAAMYFSAFAQGNGELIASYSTELESKTREANGPMVDISILKGAIGQIDLISTFQTSTAKTLWANVAINGVTATACGNYIRSALVANAGVIQGVASGTRAVFYDYLDGSDPQMVQASLARLFLLASASGMTVTPAGAENSSLATCATAANVAQI